MDNVNKAVLYIMVCICQMIISKCAEEFAIPLAVLVLIHPYAYPVMESE